MTRKGEWIQTYTGRRFWPMDPRPDEIALEDIAHSLSMQCRYAGHCVRFYSVAEHSVHIARHVSEANKRWALVHDAPEAFLVDVPRPVKPYLTGYYEHEARIMVAICQRFNLPLAMPNEVHAADHGIIADERSNLSECEAEWTTNHKPIGAELAYWPPELAEYEFLKMCRQHGVR